jgi:hypothetical protein
MLKERGFAKSISVIISAVSSILCGCHDIYQFETSSHLCQDNHSDRRLAFCIHFSNHPLRHLILFYFIAIIVFDEQFEL